MTCGKWTSASVTPAMFSEYRLLVRADLFERLHDLAVVLVGRGGRRAGARRFRRRPRHRCCSLSTLDGHQVRDERDHDLGLGPGDVPILSRK